MPIRITRHIKFDPPSRAPEPVKGGKHNAVIDEVRARVIADYRTMGAKKVGERYGLHRQTVINIVRAAGEQVRKPYHRADPV